MFKTFSEWLTEQWNVNQNAINQSTTPQSSFADTVSQPHVMVKGLADAVQSLDVRDDNQIRNLYERAMLAHNYVVNAGSHTRFASDQNVLLGNFQYAIQSIINKLTQGGYQGPYLAAFQKITR